MQLSSSRPIAQNVKVWFKKHAWELFQYISVLFGNRFELNNDLKAIVEMTRPNKHQSRTVGQIVALVQYVAQIRIKLFEVAQNLIKLFEQGRSYGCQGGHCPPKFCLAPQNFPRDVMPLE